MDDDFDTGELTALALTGAELFRLIKGTALEADAHDLLGQRQTGLLARAERVFTAELNGE